MNENASNERFSEWAMKAVVIYDDFELVANATALLELVMPPVDEAAADAVRWNVKSYPLEVLQETALAAAVLVEATNADLIALAMYNTNSLPPYVADWLESWALNRRIKDPEFVVLGGERHAGSRPSPTHQVRRLARRHGLNCICDNEPSAADGPTGFRPDLELQRPSGEHYPCLQGATIAL